jgi:hypothetical protein
MALEVSVRLKRFSALVATTVILLMLVLTLLPTPALAAPNIVLSPTSGTVGTQVTAKGENFNSYAGDQVHIYFVNTEVGGSPITVPGNGQFTHTFLVPDDAMPGTALVTVRDESGNQLAKMEFTVPPPHITLDKGGGVVGTTITINGSGFRADQTVTFVYTDHTEINLGSVPASPVGECTYVFAIPESTGKEHKVIATDPAGNTAQTTLSVIPTIVLDPVSGAIGETVSARGTGFGYKSRFTIDFEENQVKTDKTDDNGSFDISFKVPDMPLQTYNVTISDTEGNTAVIAFTISAGEVSFIFPQWGIYALMGIVVVGFFILGIWIGRRFAYTY